MVIICIRSIQQTKKVSYDTPTSRTGTGGFLTTVGMPAGLVKCVGGFKFLRNGPLALTRHNFLILIDCCTLFSIRLSHELADKRWTNVYVR